MGRKPVLAAVLHNSFVRGDSGSASLQFEERQQLNQAIYHVRGTGRLQLLHFQLDDPGLVPGAQRVGVCGGGDQQDAMFIVPPEHNLGVRLLLTERS